MPRIARHGGYVRSFSCSRALAFFRTEPSVGLGQKRNVIMDTSSRRTFLQSSGGVLGAALVPSLGLSGGAHAAAKEQLPRIWHSADVLIGNSVTEQSPSPIITCPMFYPNGHFANASHTLDLSAFPVKGNISWQGETISPDFSRSFAAGTTTGTDSYLYLLTAGEAEVVGGEGPFSDVTQAIVRCKYKVVNQNGQLLLVACVNCVAIFVRK